MSLSPDANYDFPTFSPPDESDLFLVSEHHTYRYADLKKFEVFFQAFLKKNNFDFSSPLAFVATSSDEFVFAIAACWRLGIPFVPLNPESPFHVLQNKLKLVAPVLIFTDQPQQLNKGFPYQTITIDKLDLGDIFKENNQPDLADGIPKSGIKAESIFGYFFTSGTTGTPKIVPLKRRQMRFAAYASAQNFRPSSNHYWLLCMPLNHVGGISVILRSVLYGSTIYRMDSFDTDKVARHLSGNTSFQAASFVPTMLKRLLDKPHFETHPKMKAVLLGGGPVDDYLIEASIARGIPVVTSYGMTETCAQIAAGFVNKNWKNRSTISAGHIFNPNQISIRDNNCNALRHNESGSIWLKGPQLFDGYLNQDYQQYFDEDGWFNTGDFGYLDANNQLVLEARRSDLIISGGENVSPFEVEAKINRIKTVKEAAVLGVPDPEWGEKIVAVIVYNQGHISTDEIKDQLARHLEAYKIPKIIKRLDALPRTHSGKVKRKALIKYF